MSTTPRVEPPSPQGSLNAETLWALSTGGSDVAADPQTNTLNIPLGPMAPGASEAVAWLRDALDNSTPQRLLFLVGGPGAGKSRAASRIVEGLNLREGDALDDGLAHRSYLYATSGRDLLVVNDATIGEASTEGALEADVARALDKSQHLVACINRGVLVDEAHCLGSSLSSDILRWVTDGGSEVIRDRSFANGAVEVVAVYMDQCSLLEEQPTVENHNGEWKRSPYRTKQTCSAERTATPAGKLMSEAVRSFVWPTSELGDLDPVQANIASLSSQRVVDGLLSTMRGAEIISSHRMTYRDIWGCVARAVAGDLPNQTTAAEAQGRLAELLEGEDFEALQRLASHRWFVAIFGGLRPDSTFCAADPVLSTMAAADPIFDADPEWATCVFDAFSASAIGRSPLVELEPSLISAGLGEAIQGFDRHLDEQFVAYCERDIKPQKRQAAQSWYGAYLLRLYATATGAPAFQRVVDAWAATHRFHRLSDDLSAGLRMLLSPRRVPGDSHSGPIVPVFASRTDPIIGYVNEPVVTFESGVLKFTAHRFGDELQLDVTEDGRSLGAIPLDFDLVREALACSADWLGMTDGTRHVSPRIERFRSKRLRSSLLKDAQSGLSVASRDALIPISVDPGE